MRRNHAVSAISSPLDRFQKAVGLRKDGGRISLEGVLTGAALGILLLYIVEEAAISAGIPRGAGPLEDPGDLELGAFRTSVGGIPINPLDEIELGPVGGQPSMSGSADPSIPTAHGGGGIGGFPQPAQAPEEPIEGVLVPRRPAEIGAGDGGSIPSLRISGVVPGTPKDQPDGSVNPPPPPQPPQPPEPPKPPPTPVTRRLPTVFLVLVRTDDTSTTRSLEDQSSGNQTLNQSGIQFSRIDLRQAGGVSLEVLSDRLMQGTAISALDASSLRQITDHVTLLQSQLIGAATSDVYLLTARDLLVLGLLSDSGANAEVRSRTASMDGSRLQDSGGDDLLGLQSNLQLAFTGLGDSQRASLAFELLTQGMRDSAMELGAGANVVTVTSGFYGDMGTISIAAASTAEQNAASPGAAGIRFDLDDQAIDLAVNRAWSFNLAATAIGIENSSINTGGGDDQVTIYTVIDENLRNDLGSLYSDPSTSINLNRIGMLNSSLFTGAGNDLVRINGAVVNSTIDLGDGDNILILEQPLQGSSRIVSGSGHNQILITPGLGGSVFGSSGNDSFDLADLPLAGRLDGGAGQDTLSNLRSNQRDQALIQGHDQGFLAGLQFSSIEGLNLGPGADVALVSLEGSLSGQLLGGDGLDRLEFSNWTLPVTVDLDLGTATGIYGGAGGGIRGFEQVIGGIGNDTLAASAGFAGLDGNQGNDVLFLRWTPWLSAYRTGLELRGGAGRDLFVIAGLEAGVPKGWDGLSGIPVLTDLNLNLDPDKSSDNLDQIGWLRQVANGSGSSQEFLSLTPAGLEGLGNVKLLPIATLAQLLSGMTSPTPQLAIAYDPSRSGTMAELRLLGSEGAGTSRLIAYVPGDVHSHGTATGTTTS